MSKHARVGGSARLILAGAALAFLIAGAAAAAQERTTDQIVRFHQSRVAADPDDPLAYNRLATAYVQQARESGDLTYYGLAAQQARRSLQLLPTGPAAARATTVLAVVDLARHEFSQTLVHARAALDLNPADAAPHAVAGDALVELGEYDQAAQAYARLATHTGPRGPDS